MSGSQGIILQSFKVKFIAFVLLPSCLQIIWEQLKWLPTTIIFFNSVLFHMTEVCAIYFLGLPVVWGATSKVRL